jgi:hypothetical protein
MVVFNPPSLESSVAVSQQDSSLDTPADFPGEQLHAPLPPVKSPATPLRDSPPLREGLPATYRMRADAHYVDLLTARTPAVEQQIAVADIETPADALDADAPIDTLVESVRRHGVLQPLLVQKRTGGRVRLIAGRRRLAAAMAAGLREVPCFVHDVNQDKAKALAEAANLRVNAGTAAAASPRVADAQASPVGALLEQSLSTLMACSTALGAVSSSLTRGGVTELVRAEAWRASCLSTSQRLLGGNMTITASLTSVARVADTVVDAFGPELRVRGATIDPEISKALSVPADAQILGAALANAIFLTLGVLDGREGARITLTASSSDSGVTLLVSQQHAGVVDSWASRALDEHWTARPGGEMAYVAAQTVHAAAELHGGHCQLTGTSRGTRVAITFPLLVS